MTRATPAHATNATAQAAGAQDAPAVAPIGRLFLVPTPLDFGCDERLMQPIAALLPQHTITTAARISHWVTENAKSTRAFLNRVHEHTPLARTLQDMDIKTLPRSVHKQGDHRTDAFDEEAKAFLTPALAGNDVALISEAGMPAIADPGSSVVRAAHTLGISVVPLTGPISLMLALAASGLNGQQFAFVGYLPKGAEQLAHIRQLESRALKTLETQICIETPYRNDALLQTMLATLQPTTRLAIASGLAVEPTVISLTIAQWKKQYKAGNIPRFPLPAVFLWGA